MKNFDEFKNYIRNVPDFPKKGILFRDLTTLWKNKEAFKESIDIIANNYKNVKIDKIVAAESRGFVIGAALAYILNAGFVPVRKKGKLPAEVIKVEYELEYGKDVLTMHKDAIEKGEKVLIVDDLIATGGTAKAIAELVKQREAEIVGFAFLVELTDLKGREILKDYNVFSVVKY